MSCEMNYNAPSFPCPQCYSCTNAHHNATNPMQNTYTPFYDDQKSRFATGFNPFRDDMLSVQPNPMPSLPSYSPPTHSNAFNPSFHPSYNESIRQNEQNGYFENPYSDVGTGFSPLNDDNNTIYTGSNASNSYEQLPFPNAMDRNNVNMQQPSICNCPYCPAPPQGSQSQSQSQNQNQIQKQSATFLPQNANAEVQSNQMLKFSGSGYDHNPFKNSFNNNMNNINTNNTPSIHALRQALKKGIGHNQMALRIAQIVSSLLSNQSNARQMAQILMKENVVNVLKCAIDIHASYPQVQKQCQYALTLLNRLQITCNIASFKGNILNNEAETGAETKRKKKSAQYKKEGDGYKCEHCGKVYRYICNLRSHSKIHSDAAHVCEFCNKRFGRKANYIEHRRVHTGETPFQCKICNKRFKQRHSWKNHVEKHKMK